MLKDHCIKEWPIILFLSGFFHWIHELIKTSGARNHWIFSNGQPSYCNVGEAGRTSPPWKPGHSREASSSFLGVSFGHQILWYPYSFWNSHQAVWTWRESDASLFTRNKVTDICVRPCLQVGSSMWMPICPHARSDVYSLLVWLGGMDMV